MQTLLFTAEISPLNFNSKYKAPIRLLQAIKTPLKLDITGNHDFTMDVPVFDKKVAEAQSPESERVERVGINTVDVVMTHEPPRGIMDYTHSGERAGCPDLFRALARAQSPPRMHCFTFMESGVRNSLRDGTELPLYLLT
ncbi:uncharacterized protein N7511_006675 [Penicillium nucicola]|uniref:uncharacterized protein n=1 Tax=Penicillium nucicola TaxID=1850975 RepID=UPI002544DA15|nr:uncharacterized protein N7511_006675 [Penicillium nucicola]KAJ5757981.1 hypothetical protein N7511_006675 [Penicillium nucicola]